MLIKYLLLGACLTLTFFVGRWTGMRGGLRSGSYSVVNENKGVSKSWIINEQDEIVIPSSAYISSIDCDFITGVSIENDATDRIGRSGNSAHHPIFPRIAYFVLEVSTGKVKWFEDPQMLREVK